MNGGQMWAQETQRVLKPQQIRMIAIYNTYCKICITIRVLWQPVHLDTQFPQVHQLP